MISKISDRPYLLLWLVPIPYIVIAAFIFPWGTIDMVFHDTYFVVSWVSLAALVSVLTLVSFVLYLRCHKYLWLKALTWIQVIFIIAFTYLYCLLLTFWGGAGTPRRHYEFDIDTQNEWLWGTIQKDKDFYLFGDYLKDATFVISMLTLVLYVLNVTAGFFLKKQD